MEEISPFLEHCLSEKKPYEDTNEINIYEELVNNSERFPIDFPISTIRCKTLFEKVGQDVLEKNIVSTYPLIHERVLLLMCHFLIHKREHGSNIEKELYENMSLIELVDRLLKQRAVMFVGGGDRFLLMNKIAGLLEWSTIGTEEEKSPLILSDCLSYDELKLSAMLYVSGHTAFINDGSRNNSGVAEPSAELFENAGVIIGLIGTRLTKMYFMEYQEIILTPNQNTKENGYGKRDSFFDMIVSKMWSTSNQKESTKACWRSLWEDFYSEPSLPYEEALKIYKKESNNFNSKGKHGGRYGYKKNVLFDNVIYSKHLAVAFDCTLLEANKRGNLEETMAYLHVVGIGLGFWRAFPHQNQEFIKTFLERLQYLSSNLSSISDVHFAYFGEISKGGIKIHLSNREPSSKLTGEHAGKLLIETYAWDGNAQPGNDFWCGNLATSGDPAAACSTQVAELHNSHINKRFVCGSNLHVAGKYGLKHVSEYVKDILSNLTIPNE